MEISHEDELTTLNTLRQVVWTRMKYEDRASLLVATPLLTALAGTLFEDDFYSEVMQEALALRRGNLFWCDFKSGLDAGYWYAGKCAGCMFVVTARRENYVAFSYAAVKREARPTKWANDDEERSEANDDEYVLSICPHDAGIGSPAGIMYWPDEAAGAPIAKARRRTGGLHHDAVGRIVRCCEHTYVPLRGAEYFTDDACCTCLRTRDAPVKFRDEFPDGLDAFYDAFHCEHCGSRIPGELPK